ncbi:MAG: site-specific integrase [Bacteroidales bacterium]|nr:site-specific integrase [Bacteroidales bacterium]
MKYTFYFNHPDQDVSLIMMAIRQGGKRVTVSTELSDRPAAWDKKSQTVLKSPDATYTNEMLSHWKAAANAVSRDPELADATAGVLRDRILERMGRGSDRPKANLLLPYYNRWSMTSTARRQASRQMVYSYNLISQFASPTTTFEDVTASWGERYIEWLRQRGCAANTRSTQIKNLKTVMNQAMADGLHKNDSFRQIKREREEVDSVYLTDKELKAVEEHVFVGTKEMARDLFVIGCHTAMRWSDYSRLSILDIQGGYIRQIQQKTKERVIIPVHPKVAEIVQKWNGAPKLSQQKFNALIKDVCRESGVTEIVTIMKNGRQERHEKWELVSSHTARRTAATNMYKAGIPSISIMQITGHRSESCFLRYIKVGKEENAKLLKSHKFFTE